MFEFLPFVLISSGLAASLAYLLSRMRTEGRMEVWRKAAAHAHLTDVTGQSGPFGASLRGRAGELRVTLTGYRHGKHERGTRIQVNVGAPLSLRLEGVGTSLGKRFVGLRELEIGDHAFDEACFIEMPAPLALAVLTPELRLSLPSVLRGEVAVGRSSAGVRVSLINGVLQVDLREQWFSPGYLVPELLQSVLEIARRLAPPHDVAARLAENLRSEPQPGVRAQLVLALAREFANHPAAQDALLAARQDASDEVRLRAAIALGEQGRETLRALVAREDGDDSCTARAVAGLGDQLGGDDASATLRRALRSRRLSTAAACIDRLARLGSASEPLLLEVLQDENADVRLAGLRALGTAGTARAVAPLLELAASGGSFPAAVRQAVAEIQSRLPGAGPGQLTVAGGEAGALSLADGEPGRLSLPEPDQVPSGSSR